MAVFDAHKNLALATVAVAPSPALSGTSLIITAGFVGLFPAVPFNCTVFPGNASPTDANAEIVRVTNIVGDIFTIVRAQEGTTAKPIASGYRIGNTVTVKVFTDIENAVNSVSSQAIMSISAGASNATGNQVVFSNSNGVSFGASNNVITASFSGGGGGGGAAISAGANSQSTGTVVFSNSNGVTFGLSNNGVLTASHDGVTNALTSQSNQAASASNGSFAFQTLAFSNANNVTFGTSAGSIITASVATAAAGNSVNFSAGTESSNLASVVFSNSNGVTFGLDAGTITAQHNGLTSQSNQAFSAQGGSSAFQTLNFADSNGITFSNSNGSVVASHNGLTSQSNQAASASNGSFAFQTLAFSNANNVTFGTSAGGIITASVATAAGGGSINFSAGTQSADLASIVFSNSNNVTFGLDNGTITASAAAAAGAGGTISQFSQPPYFAGGGLTPLFNGNSSNAMAFMMPAAISFDFVRFPIRATNGSYSRGTVAVASATGQADFYQTFNVHIYSFGTGASSMSLQMVTSASAGSTFRNLATISNSSEGSYNIGLTIPFQGGTISAQTLYSLTTSNYQFSSNFASNFTGDRFFDVPLQASLPPGNYWMIAGRNAAASTFGHAFISAAYNNSVTVGSIFYASQIDFAMREMGQTFSSSAIYGGGNFTSVGVNTTASLNYSQISRNGSNYIMPFQLLRYA